MTYKLINFNKLKINFKQYFFISFDIELTLGK